MLAVKGLHPTSKGARVRLARNKRTVIDGPFGETKERIGGFWLCQVKSKDEAIAWVKRCPNPHNEDCDIEIRQIFEAEDFGAALTPSYGRKRSACARQPERAKRKAGNSGLPVLSGEFRPTKEKEIPCKSNPI